ncbi:MAG TPA: 6-bladed beta-propeller, partial [Motiliproteus sp.]
MKNATFPSLVRTFAATSCGLIASVLLTACAPPTYVPPVLPPLVYPKPPDEARFYHERTIRSSADIVIDSEENRMMRFMTGVQRTGVGLGKPFGIAVHKNLMWVTDPGSRKVLVFDSKNRRYRTVGTTQPGLLRKPYDIETDSMGNAYVMDGTLKTVMVYNADGQFVKAIGSGADFNLPSYLAVNADGSKVFVVDTGGVTSQKHEVIVFDATTGKELYRFGKRGSGPGEVNLPKDITISPDNRIYLVDSGNFRVNVYEEDGTFIKSFGSIGLRLGTFSRPKGIA